MKRIAIILFILLCGTMLVACDDEPRTKQKPKKAVKASSQSTKDKAVKKLPAPPVEEVNTYVYQGSNRRDPFVPLTSKRRPIGPAIDRPLEPLEKFEIKQLKLVAVLLGFEQPRAMLKAPDGKTYIVTPGNRIGKNRGVLTKINDDFIVIDEKYQDFAGEVRTSQKRIELPVRKGI